VAAPPLVIRLEDEGFDHARLAPAVQALRAGDLVIYPTDTLYALGARALDAEAVARVAEAKGRSADRPFPLIAATEEQARSLLEEWPAGAARLAARWWPGPLTLVLAGRPGLPAGVRSAAGLVAVRVPRAGLARALAGEAGPLVATSANRSGRTAPTTCAEAVAEVGGSARVAVDAGPGRAVPSTLVEVRGEALRLLRPGAVAWTDIVEAGSARRDGA
jgi:L-threonylcarbamoyladenylate synthase